MLLRTDECWCQRAPPPNWVTLHDMSMQATLLLRPCLYYDNGALWIWMAMPRPQKRESNIVKSHLLTRVARKSESPNKYLQCRLRCHWQIRQTFSSTQIVSSRNKEKCFLFSYCHLLRNSIWLNLMLHRSPILLMGKKEKNPRLKYCELTYTLQFCSPHLLRLFMSMVSNCWWLRTILLLCSRR